MKLLASWLLACVAAVNLQGQGTIPFRNDNTCPVINSLTGARVAAGNAFAVTLNVAPDGEINPAAFAQLGGSATFYQPGLFDGGSRTAVLPMPSEYAMVQIKVWEAAYGATFEAAVAAPEKNGRLALRGTSAILRVRLCTPSSPPICPSLSQQGLRTIFLTVPRFNTPPIISAIPNQTVNEDGLLGPIGFTVQDAQTAAEGLTVSATSGDSSLVRPENITLAGTGVNRTVSVLPEPNQFGTTGITLTVADADGASATTTFTVTVTAVDDFPEVSFIPDQTIQENGVGTIPFTVRDVEATASALIVSGVSSNALLVRDANLVFGGAGTNRTVTVTPVANRVGQTAITISVSDPAGMTTPRTFLVTVVPRLQVRKDSGGVVVSWTAVNAALQTADDPGRNWNDVGASASSPYRVPTGSCGFYRLREK